MKKMQKRADSQLQHDYGARIIIPRTGGRACPRCGAKIGGSDHCSACGYPQMRKPG